MFVGTLSNEVFLARHVSESEPEKPDSITLRLPLVAAAESPEPATTREAFENISLSTRKAALNVVSGSIFKLDRYSRTINEHFHLYFDRNDQWRSEYYSSI
jgi:hypothetical protein